MKKSPVPARNLLFLGPKSSPIVPLCDTGAGPCKHFLLPAGMLALPTECYGGTLKEERLLPISMYSFLSSGFSVIQRSPVSFSGTPWGHTSKFHQLPLGSFPGIHAPLLGRRTCWQVLQQAPQLAFQDFHR